MVEREGIILVKIFAEFKLNSKNVCINLEICSGTPNNNDVATIYKSTLIKSNLSDTSKESDFSAFNKKDGIGYILHISDIHIDIF